MELGRTFYTTKGVNLEKYHLLSNVKKTYSQAMQGLFDASLNYPFYLEFRMAADHSSMQEELACKKPHLIFYDLGEAAQEGDSDLPGLSLLVQYIKNVDGYRPIVVVMGSPSKSDALRKLFSYEKIMSFANKFEVDIFCKLAESFIQKKKLVHSQEHFFIKYSDSRGIFDVKSEVEVSSLTEHEITFRCPQELPMFTVVHLVLPVECYATIIPPLWELPGGNLNHYMAILHTVTQDDLQSLRIFVNQIIYEPFEEDFTQETVDAIYSRKKKVVEDDSCSGDVKTAEKKAPEGGEASVDSPGEKEVKKIEVNRHNVDKDKSKL